MVWSQELSPALLDFIGQPEPSTTPQDTPSAPSLPWLSSNRFSYTMESLSNVKECGEGRHIRPRPYAPLAPFGTSLPVESLNESGISLVLASPAPHLALGLAFNDARAISSTTSHNSERNDVLSPLLDEDDMPLGLIQFENVLQAADIDAQEPTQPVTPAFFPDDAQSPTLPPFRPPLIPVALPRESALNDLFLQPIPTIDMDGNRSDFFESFTGGVSPFLSPLINTPMSPRLTLVALPSLDADETSNCSLADLTADVDTMQV